MHRRDFLKASAGGLASLALPQSAHAERGNMDINQKLCEITTVLRNSDAIKNVDLHLQCHPTKGLVQWRWVHFHKRADIMHTPEVENVNAELLTAMQEVLQVPSSGLDELWQEGMIEGRENECIDYHRGLAKLVIQWLLERPDPLQSQKTKDVTEEEIIAALHDRDQFTERVHHEILVDQRWRPVHFSALGRAGSGQFLSMLSGTKLLAAEDPEIDAMAEKAEENRISDPKAYNEWVLRRRDEHFINLVLQNKRPVQHLLVGCGHDLTDDVQKSNNENKEKISHIIVTAKSTNCTSKPS